MLPASRLSGALLLYHMAKGFLSTLLGQLQQADTLAQLGNLSSVRAAFACAGQLTVRAVTLWRRAIGHLSCVYP
ncbi:hypothetical protein HN51_25555 [Ectopseudomonas mendocina]|uniref:Uncharacterized protein n=1 Tax=Ectopseudomonas mendocina S5.2 TaxID=1225174 RepID=A0ABM5W3J2_ECTME|nr:hypothetical protein DW68_024170 [Pseudomonas mendocina S5.2]KER98164.1 hypothetical protein HN51_25555 [Pseudomonas mendocina]